MGREGALIALVTAGCSSLPFGETVVVVDAEPSVPAFVSSLRVDFFADDGTWYDSREQATPSAADWPLSFSVYTDGKVDKRVRLRLRAFPDGRVRDFHGDAWQPPPVYVEPHVPASVAELCANPPLLPMGVEQTFRIGSAYLDMPRNSGNCPNGLLGGTVAARIHVAASDTYRFRVLRDLPDGARGDTGGDTIMWLRAKCDAFTTELLCNDDWNRAAGSLLSGFDVMLNPGEYTLMIGAGSYNPIDATVAWGPAASFQPAPPDGGAPAMAPPSATLIVDGVDVTPSSEPQPAVTVDRLADVRIVPGQRRTAGVVLQGECLGTPADRPGGRSCVDTAGVLVPVVELATIAGVDRGGPTVAGAWAGEQPQPGCAQAPRNRSTGSDGTPLFDEEVCVPGGALTLGDQRITGTSIDPSPEQVAVVAPFVIDRYEVTVGRFRQALRDGFNPPDETPTSNPGTLAYGAGARRQCTFSGGELAPAPGIDRERFPLNCITWYAARAVCRFWGGDLPTVAEWEHAARKAGGVDERDYPWGNDPPSCATTWYGRPPLRELSVCPPGPAGPIAVDGPELANDVTPLGIIGLAGNVTELTLDSARPYDDACWHQQLLRNVGCSEVDAPLRYTKGGFFAEGTPALRAAQNDIGDPGLPETGSGFRCVRR